EANDGSPVVDWRFSADAPTTTNAATLDAATTSAATTRIVATIIAVSDSERRRSIALRGLRGAIRRLISIAGEEARELGGNGRGCVIVGAIHASQEMRSSLRCTRS